MPRFNRPDRTEEGSGHAHSTKTPSRTLADVLDGKTEWSAEEVTELGKAFAWGPLAGWAASVVGVVEYARSSIIERSITGVEPADPD
jgi:hypothetical protein